MSQMQGDRAAQPDHLPEVDELARRVYQAIAAYAPNEPECHPSQALIAEDVGVARETVNRAVHRLLKAGWLVVRKRRAWRNQWWHNVYELMAPFAVSALAMKRITRRAHRRARRAQKWSMSRDDHTNQSSRCECRGCRVDRSWTAKPPPHLFGWLERLRQDLAFAGLEYG